MSKRDITIEIEQNTSKNIRIADELSEIVEFLCLSGATEDNGKALKTKAVVQNCAEANYNRLNRLVEHGLVRKISKGPSTYVIHEREDEILNGEPLKPYIDEEIRRLVADMKKRPAIEQVVANALDVPIAEAEQELTSGNDDERREKLEKAVEAIREDKSVSIGDYGAIIFRNSSNLYQASKEGERLYKK